MTNLFSSAGVSSARRLQRVGAELLAICALGLITASLAAADTSSLVPSATPLGFPSGYANNGVWDMNGSACSTSGSCVAVGEYEDGSGHTQAYVDSIVDGVPGAALEVPLPDAATNPNATLTDVSCTAGDVCEAYGSYDSASTTNVPIVVQITDGVPATAIAVVPPVGIENGNDQFYFPTGISCYSASGCVVAGTYETSTNVYLPFVEPILGGAPQTVITVQLPTGAMSNSDDQLQSVACQQSSGDCVAVGEYVNTAGKDIGLIVPVSAGVVGVGQGAAPSGLNASQPYVDFNQVACPPSGACEAIGSFYDDNDDTHNMVVPISNGTPGTVSVASAPAGYYGSESFVGINGISCSSASLCVAAGSFLNSTSHYQAAVVTITGTSATAYAASPPDDLSSVDPGSSFSNNTIANPIGCVPSGPCLAGGYYVTYGSDDAESAMNEAISAGGAVGSDIATPAPADVDPTGPSNDGPWYYEDFGVDCVGAGSCIELGEYYSQADQYLPYVTSEQEPLSVTTSSLAGAEQGMAYQASLAASGAWGSYTWSVSAGSLPAGLTLDSQTGVISGTPSGSGSSSFTVQATGTGAPVQTATAQLTVAVAAAATTTTTPAPPAPVRPLLSLRTVGGRVSGGRVKVKLACADATCRGVVKLELSEVVTVKHGGKRVRKHRTVVIGSADYSLATGAAKTLAVKLTGTGKTALAKAKHHRLAVTVTATVTGGSQVKRGATISTAA